MTSAQRLLFCQFFKSWPSWPTGPVTALSGQPMVAAGPLRQQRESFGKRKFVSCPWEDCAPGMSFADCAHLISMFGMMGGRGSWPVWRWELVFMTDVHCAFLKSKLCKPWQLPHVDRCCGTTSYALVLQSCFQEIAHCSWSLLVNNGESWLVLMII